MAKYIEAEALMKELESKRLVFDDPVNFKEAQIRADALKKQGAIIRETIENFPAADVVEVVRCRECRKCTGCDDFWCEEVPEGTYHEPDYFCGNGIRREESKDQENKPFADLYNAFVERSKR